MIVADTMPANKTELLAFTERNWRAFVAYTDSLTDEEWVSPVDERGWTVKDHVAHVVTWTRVKTALLRYGTPLQQSAGIPDTIWNSGDDAINEAARQPSIHDSPAAIRAARDAAFPKLLEALNRLSDEALAAPASDQWFFTPGASLLAVQIDYHGKHFAEHREYIQAIVAGRKA